MNFSLYRNTISQAGKRFAAGALTTGLILIGFGILIIAIPAIFIFIAATLFFLAGASCITTAAKIFLAQRQINKIGRDDSEGHRENVRIHIEEHYGQ